MPLNPDTQRNAERMLAAMHIRLASLTELLRVELTPELDVAPDATALDLVVKGSVQRALAWGLSLRKLADVYDFQAHSAGCRSLFEIAVDLALLTEKLEPVEKLIAWEELCRVRAAREVALDPTGPFAHVRNQAIALLAQDEARADQLLKLHWPGERRAPTRWTGRGGLRADAARADGKKDRGFVRFATKNYARLNWGTHGSGLLLPKSLGANNFPGVSILAVGESFELLSTTIRIALEHFGKDLAAWERRIHAARTSGPVGVTLQELEEVVRLAESGVDVTP